MGTLTLLQEQQYRGGRSDEARRKVIHERGQVTRVVFLRFHIILKLDTLCCPF